MNRQFRQFETVGFKTLRSVSKHISLSVFDLRGIACFLFPTVYCRLILRTSGKHRARLTFSRRGVSENDHYPRPPGQITRRAGCR